MNYPTHIAQVIVMCQGSCLLAAGCLFEKKNAAVESVALAVVIVGHSLVIGYLEAREIYQDLHNENELLLSNIPEFKPVGCFKDRGIKPRPLPELIVSLRGSIDWTNLNKTIADCARRVNETGFHYFAIQFYGECWSGKNAERTYNQQGFSKRCMSGVGRGNANFVYAFVENEMEVRLVNGSRETRGRVEVFHRGKWGTVCDKDWDMRDANVVCRMLGFPGALSAPRGATFGQGAGAVRLGTVGCKGSETNLALCSHKDYNDCTHLHDAGAVCRVSSNVPQPRIPYRLVGGPRRSEGRVEVFNSGRWGTICNRGWDLTDATILCRMLAYTGATATPSYGTGTGLIWLSDVSCKGGENSIFRCKHAGWGNIVNCDHSNDAGVQCY